MKILPVALLVLWLTAGGQAVNAAPAVPPSGTDLVRYYQDHDRTPVGKVGILFTGLMMPERLEQQPDLFYYLAVKSPAVTRGPTGATGEHPVVLLDRARFHARAAFEPAELVDAWGRTADSTGVSYLAKYRQGRIAWVPAKGRLESGYFLDESERSDWPPPAQKTTANARLWYYGVGLDPNRMPHESGVRDVVRLAVERLRDRYGPLEVRHVNAPIPSQVEEAVTGLLDAGADTLVLVSTQVIHSNYKVLGKGASFYQAVQAAERWRARNGGRPVKIVLTDPMGHYEPMRRAFTTLVKDRLDQLPAGADVDVLLSSHGMPWDKFPEESYPALARPYTDGLKADMEKLLAGYDFGRTRVTISQDLYADPEDDPAGRYTSTNEAYRAAVADGFDVIITVPTSFYAESTDTLFAHALHAFDGVPGYEPFATIPYPDWSKPLVREFRMGDTTILYNGLPVGPYRRHVADALAESVEAVLGKAGERVPSSAGGPALPGRFEAR